ncbi:Dehydroquinate synthase-like protein [Rhizodiscina lignyota]|uniref:Dehydroquinate synthase-like protein n=1 Tax=Rhizodiscina lignyota TaxID=1504668 RepID=A0A9P4I7C8_9PEZI|nr:Dehydroquinate synthase-like protein [Rhizodiscina lignyota]
MAAKETYRPAFEGAHTYVSYGLPFPEACAKHVQETFNAKRVYIIASKSLSTNTDALERLKKALGDKVAGVRVGMTPHTLWSEILEIAEDAGKVDADLIITLGAGSLTDGSKIIALAMANNAKTFDELNNLHSGTDWKRARPDLKSPAIPIICIPTSLSGGEYQDLAGGTRDDTHHKQAFVGPIKGPALVLLDPELTTTTPEWVWLSTGIRGVDHCVETMCSLLSNDEADVTAGEALGLLVPALLKCKHDPTDLDARLQSQMGVIKAMQAVKNGVPMGASHAIGHQLGPLGVGHGETSCILLPAVCKFNESVNKDRQARVLEILWGNTDVEKVLKAGGLSKEKADLGDVLDVVIRELGMPRSLKEKGVGRDKLDTLAKNSLHDQWIKTNPIPIDQESQVMTILEAVVG